MAKKNNTRGTKGHGLFGGVCAKKLVAFVLLTAIAVILASIITGLAVTGAAIPARLMVTLVLLLLAIIIAAVAVALFMSRRTAFEIRTIKQAVKQVSKGDYDIQVPEKSVDNEVAGLAAAFNQMTRAVNERELSQRSFLGSVTHDMRTPMTSIAGFVDGILDGTIPKEQQEKYLKIVSSETHRLSRLVGSLLDLTRIQSGERKFNKTEFDICELLRLILISMEKQIEEKRIEIEFETDGERCTAFADRDGIHQVAYNLIHNAIKFTDEGGLIRISVEKQDNDRYIVSVYNTGKGMKSEELPYIFDRFYKADASRGLDKTGVGLGLYIVKTILTAHAEDIWAESEENKYGCFKFTLSKAQTAVQENSDSKKGTV